MYIVIPRFYGMYKYYVTFLLGKVITLYFQNVKRKLLRYVNVLPLVKKFSSAGIVTLYIAVNYNHFFILRVLFVLKLYTDKSLRLAGFLRMRAAVHPRVNLR